MSKMRYTVFNEVRIQRGGEVLVWAQCPTRTQIVVIRREPDATGKNGRARYEVTYYSELSNRFYKTKQFAMLADAYLHWQAETELHCWRFMRDE